MKEVLKKVSKETIGNKGRKEEGGRKENFIYETREVLALPA
jgi:hypothetical protein